MSLLTLFRRRRPVGPPSAPPDLGGRCYPLEAQLVSVAQRAQLQTLLDLYGTIRLEPGGNYVQGGPAQLTVRSGQKVYGLGTVLPPVLIPAGCTQALVSGVITDLRFVQPGAAVRGCLFRRVQYRSIVVDGATVEQCTFQDSYLCRWAIDNRTSGWFRDNRIIRTIYQNTQDAFVWSADAAGRSTGNVILGANHLTPPKGKFRFVGLPALALINYDCESPGSDGSAAVDWSGPGRLAACSTTGTNKLGLGVRLTAGATAWLHGAVLGCQQVGAATINAAGATILVQSMLSTSLAVVAPTAGTDVRGFDEQLSSATVTLDGVANPTSATTTQRAALQAAVAPDLGPAWPAFTHPTPPTIPDSHPTGPYTRAQIQAMLDANGGSVVYLPLGIYWIDQPLRLGPGRALVGAGQGQTFLVATSGSVDLICDVNPASGATAITLCELSLCNGRRGILHTLPVGTQQLRWTNSLVSHVGILDMSEAGWLLTDAFSHDNNHWDRIAFVRCASGFKQLATKSGTEATEPRLNYMDKSVWHRCQWIDCGRALDLTAIRASGGNIWAECRFSGSTVCVARAVNHNPMLFANCDFVNNAGLAGGGAALATNGRLLVIASRWRAGAANPAGLVDSMHITLEGCTFDRAGAASTAINAGQGGSISLANPTNAAQYAHRRLYLFNCQSTDMPVGSPQHILYVNNDWGIGAAESVRWAYRRLGALTVLDPAAPLAGTRLLATTPAAAPPPDPTTPPPDPITPATALPTGSAALVPRSFVTALVAAPSAELYGSGWVADIVPQESA